MLRPRLSYAALVLLVWCPAAAPAAAQQQGVEWQHDIETAKQLAQQTGRLVLVHFWTPECGPCQMLEQNVFNQPGVAGAIQSRFVPVKLNANENPATAQGFGITRVPTDVILTAEGQVAGMLISPPTPSAYLAEVTQVATQYRARSGGAFDNAVAAAPQPSQLNSAYADLPVDAVTPPVAHADSPPAAGPASGTHGASTGSDGRASLPSYQTPFATSQALPTTSGSPHAPADATAANGPAGRPAPNDTAAPMVPPSVVNNQYASSGAPAPEPSSTERGGSPPDASRLPPGAPPLGFDGFCSVSMRESDLTRWVPGDPQWGAIHRGRTYWFAGSKEQQKFLANPDFYAPVLSGLDPVLAIEHQQQVPGRREFAIDYDHLFYFFASEATLQQFTANPERYAASARQAMGIERGRLVR